MADQNPRGQNKLKELYDGTLFSFCDRMSPQAVSLSVYQLFIWKENNKKIFGYLNAEDKKFLFTDEQLEKYVCVISCVNTCLQFYR